MTEVVELAKVGATHVFTIDSQADGKACGTGLNVAGRQLFASVFATGFTADVDAVHTRDLVETCTRLTVSYHFPLTINVCCEHSGCELAPNVRSSNGRLNKSIGRKRVNVANGACGDTLPERRAYLFPIRVPGSGRI